MYTPPSVVIGQRLRGPPKKLLPIDNGGFPLVASWLLRFIASETFNAGFARAISVLWDPPVASILEGVHCRGLWGCVLAGMPGARLRDVAGKFRSGH